MSTKSTNTIAINDPVVNSIVEHYRSETGDKTLTRTAGRIIQAFHAAGMRLIPERTNNDSSTAKGQLIDAHA